MPYRKLGPGPKEKRTFAVIGAGHGGQAMAAFLAYSGHRVNLYNRRPERIEPIRARGGIEIEGEIHGFGKLALVTADLGKALEGAEIIMVVVPSSAHRCIAERCAPHLKPGQCVLLHPGRTGGALEFYDIFHRRGVPEDVIVGEAQTFIYASRSTGPGEVRVHRVKNIVPIAAMPATRTPELVSKVQEAYPQFVGAPSVLKTSLDNMGAIFHPALIILNAGRIESTGGDFEFYFEGVTPSVANVLEALDRERVAVARALGVRALSAFEWLEAAYGAQGRNLWEAMHDNEGYGGIKAPPTLEHRYIFEDVPASLIPIISLGRLLGVPTPSMQTIVHLAHLIHGIDYWVVGRTVREMGLDGMSKEEIIRYTLEGRRSA
ncbi:MAG: NAD/NADP octopine/nopaline dehydrogenase family protein [Firmicutes bacterium]|nr:NAD/NADP octopine/nopaline dehydrogenase family protein [Bacillota bacterium]